MEVSKKMENLLSWWSGTINRYFVNFTKVVFCQDGKFNFSFTSNESKSLCREKHPAAFILFETLQYFQEVSATLDHQSKDYFDQQHSCSCWIVYLSMLCARCIEVSVIDMLFIESLSFGCVVECTRAYAIGCRVIFGFTYVRWVRDYFYCFNFDFDRFSWKVSVSRQLWERFLFVFLLVVI